MKKLIIMTVALILILGVFAGASATPYYLESAGVTIEVPEGMTGTDQSDDEKALLAISVEGNDALMYAYMVTYVEALAGKNLEDLSEAEATEVGMGIGAALDNPSVSYAEANGYPVLVVANGDGTQLHYIAILNGWLCDVAAVKGDGVTLADDEIQGAALLLTSITFEDDGEEVGEEEAEVDEAELEEEEEDEEE